MSECKRPSRGVSRVDLAERVANRERKKIVAYLIRRAREIGDGSTSRATAAERSLLRRRLINFAEEIEQGLHL